PAPVPLVSSRTLSYNDVDLDRIRAWLKAVASHRPGEADGSATTIAGWPATTIAVTVTDVVYLLKLRARLNASGDDNRIIKYRDKKFCICVPPLVPEVTNLNVLFGLPLDRNVGPPNLILERGAL